jgi:receptor protein-tyrosine kinase
MNDAPRYATLRDYLRVLRQHRILVVLIVVAFGGAAFVMDARKDEVYKAESSLRIRDVTQDISLQGTQIATSPTDLIYSNNTAADLIKSEALAAKVRQRLRLPVSLQTLRDSVSGQVELRTNLIVVSAKAHTPVVAARVAEAYAREVVAQRVVSERTRFDRIIASLKREQRVNRRKAKDPVTRTLVDTDYRERISRLQTAIDTSRPAELVERAEVPTNPISPKPVRDTTLGLLLGLILGVGAAFVRDSLDRRLRGTGDVRTELGLPILGRLSADGMGAAAISANGTKALPQTDFEAIRILRSNLGFLNVDSAIRTVAVTSALPEEGKSTVASNLALSYALTGKLTLLLECDLRRPSLGHRLGLQQSPGLTDYLAGDASPADILQVVDLPGIAEGDTASATAPSPLVVITAGTIVPRPAELLESEKLRALLAQLASAYEHVVIDTAPVLPVVDTLALLPHVDGIVVCARSAQTTRDQARALRTALSHLPPRPAGVVVTGITESEDETYSYYSYAYASRT